mgnify:CR=1 FL=1
MAYRPTVYFPIESKTRELGSRLLISRFLLSHGFKTVVGFNDTVVSGSGSWPRGIYFLKGMNTVQKNMTSIFKRQGYRVFAIDEEALGISDGWFLTKDVDPEICKLLDLVFCQGASQRDTLESVRGFSREQLVVSGNPRTDFLRTPLKSTLYRDAAHINEHYGRFVLINTNSGSINNIWGDLRRYLGLLVEIGWFNPESADDRSLVDDHLEHDRNNFHALRELIKDLSDRRPDIPIVVRPHPSEASGTWEQFAEDFSKVIIITDSEPAPWLQAADVVVTTGCTTGFEAVMLGRPTISLVAQPNHVRHPGFFVANQVSVVSTSVSKAMRLLEDHWDGKINLEAMEEFERTANLKEHVEIQEGMLASERIANAIADRSFLDTGETRLISIEPEHETHLRQIVKKVKWEKGFFTTDEIGGWLNTFDAHLGVSVPIRIRDIGWSTYELCGPD